MSKRTASSRSEGPDLLLTAWLLTRAMGPDGVTPEEYCRALAELGEAATATAGGGRPSRTPDAAFLLAARLAGG